MRLDRWLHHRPVRCAAERLRRSGSASFVRAIELDLASAAFSRRSRWSTRVRWPRHQPGRTTSASWPSARGSTTTTLARRQRQVRAVQSDQTEAMARLDAVLGRSPLDRAESSSPRESVPELWLDQDSPAGHEGTSDRDKGPDKGAWGRRRPRKKPDPSVDRAETGGFGTAYRIPVNSCHASHPRSRSTSKRHMRHSRRER